MKEKIDAGIIAVGTVGYATGAARFLMGDNTSGNPGMKDLVYCHVACPNKTLDHSDHCPDVMFQAGMGLSFIVGTAVCVRYLRRQLLFLKKADVGRQ